MKDHGFQFIAVEGDYPDCSKINEYVKTGDLDSFDKERSALSVLKDFKRWPTWMWANSEIIELMESMRKINQSRDDADKVGKNIEILFLSIVDLIFLFLLGFYGLDVYSLFDSIDAVKYRCSQIDPNLAEYVVKKYKCFEYFHEKEEEYIDHIIRFPEETKIMVIQVLTKLLEAKLNG